MKKKLPIFCCFEHAIISILVYIMSRSEELAIKTLCTLVICLFYALPLESDTEIGGA